MRLSIFCFDSLRKSSKVERSILKLTLSVRVLFSFSVPPAPFVPLLYIHHYDIYEITGIRESKELDYDKDKNQREGKQEEETGEETINQVF